ncbi:hypothetical protein O6H91_01G175100 [Diphasiastrum complanatum]|uniref:Uncharacterized protein n=1 Tax=Diphasiastrum complanatum TaxID=34168 RepID=A0ACC2EZ34_DIPCM|nr:hypothetical protein O6H91_Y422000 [Diphasiastrum complanatum]KAJ7571728.1 hypothetical protein O6H91_01G175100 [Diphasiastrum complanatum]
MSFKKKQRDADKGFTDRKSGNDQMLSGVSASKSFWDGHGTAAEQMGGSKSSFRKLSFVMGAAFACCSIFLLLIFFTSLPCRHPHNAEITPLFGNHSSYLISRHQYQRQHQQHQQQQQQQQEQQQHQQQQPDLYSAATLTSFRTGLGHIAFGIAASSQLWERRKEYVKCWWRPREMRGFVWLDRPVNDTYTSSKSLPPLRISADTSKFNYTNKAGNGSAIRIARIVSETFRVGLPDVHWFVMGDDDTVFIPENLVHILSKYDWRKFYYIGSISESHTQNVLFSYNMAYGGGGFAISYPLAKALEKIQDSCLHRYPYLFGSDNRMQACMAELGVPLTREEGFHQFDIYGNAFGLLAAHPIAPLLSLHHLDVIDPIFPNMTRLQAIQHLVRSGRTDPGALLQQSICYDKWHNWSYSVSWGYAVQVYRGLLPPRELERPSRTFISWYKQTGEFSFPFSTRPADVSPCQQPIVFYIKNVGHREDGQIEGNYTREARRRGNCKWKMASPARMESITVVKELTDELWYQAPHRQCCRISKAERRNTEIEVASCASDEAIL